MKKETKNGKASSYWQEVLILFTKAGAFGIINLFTVPELKIQVNDRIKAINNNHSPLLRLREDDTNESLTKIQEIA